MEERAGDMAAPAARVGQRLALGVGESEEAIVVSRREQRRVVEFVPPNGGSGRPERAVGQKPRLAAATLAMPGADA